MAAQLHCRADSGFASIVCSSFDPTYFTLPEMFDGSRLIDELEIQIIPKTATDKK